MPTTVVKSIGATGRDYSLPQSWENDRPSDHTVNVTSTTGSGSTTSAITLNAGASAVAGAYIGNTLEISGEMRLITAYDETTKVATVGSLNGSAATFTSAPGSGVSYTIGDVIWKGECYNDAPFTTQCTISGGTTSATCYVWLTAAAGQSFIDHANVRTNALAFNQANGVNFLRDAPNYEEGTIQALSAYTKVDRLQIKTNGISGSYGKRAPVECSYSGNGTVIRDCILEATYSGRDGAYIYGNSIINCVVRSTSGNGIYVVDGGTPRNCTIVVGGANCVYASYWYGGVYGCAMFGSSGLATRLTHTGAELSTGSYNGTDKSAAPGTSNQVSLTFGNVFESTTDLRLKAGSSLIGVGNTDATNAPNDITGTARDAGTAGDVGAWEWSDPTLYGQLDETSASNTDYITTTTAGSIAELQLGSVTDPGVDTLHSIKLRASGSGSLQVDLVQGSGALLTIWTSKTRTMQPQGAVGVNWANPIAHGLMIAIHPAAGNQNLALNKPSSTGPAKTVAAGLQSFNFIGTNTPIDTGFSDSAITACSGVFFVHSPNISGGMGNLISPRTSVNGGVLVVVSGGGTPPDQTVAMQVVHGGVLALTGSGSSVAGAVNARYVSLGFSDVVSGSCRYFIDGAFNTSVSSAAVNQISPSYKIGRDDWDSANATCNLAVAFWWNRALSDAEMISVQRNPWQLFAPERRPRHIPAAKPIASRTIPLIATPTDYRRELLPAEAALITNYADLRVRLRGV